jgi:ferredoxin
MDRLTILEKLIPANSAKKNLVIDKELCIGATKTRKNCSLCIEICPTGAISYSQDCTTPSISYELCTHCGACSTVCPVCAIPFGEINSELQKSQACLDYIDEAILLCLIANGQSAANEQSAADWQNAADGQNITKQQNEIVLHKKDCSVCSVGCKFDMPTLIREYVNAICEALSINAKVSIVEIETGECALDMGYLAGEQDGDTLELNRREAFSKMGATSKGIAAKLFTIIGEETLDKLDGESGIGGLTGGLTRGSGETGAAIKQTPKQKKIAKIIGRSELARLALRAIVQRENIDIDGKVLQSRLWGYPKIDPLKCTNCHLCDAYCPTSAIEKAFSGHSLIGYNIWPHKCVQCGLCLRVCRPKALEISQAVPVRMLLEADFDAQRYEQWDRIKQDMQEEKD